MVIIQNLIQSIGFSNTMVPILLTKTPSGFSIVEGGPLTMTTGRKYIAMCPPDIQDNEGTLYHTPYHGYTEVKNLSLNPFLKLTLHYQIRLLLTYE